MLPSSISVILRRTICGSLTSDVSSAHLKAKLPSVTSGGLCWKLITFNFQTFSL
ncbi:MAG: hypothetical protein ACTS6G_06565 [Candidatus Hodgkinia cicadicola]